MFVSVYMTAQSKKEAGKLASLLVTKRLAACASFFPISSVYWWQGKVEKSAEYAIIAKTKKSGMHRLINAVKRTHTYKVACIVAWPIVEGSKDYLRWVRKETH